MKHGSLFSGIGGFDLASEWMGWDNVFNCEIEDFPRKILNYYWPNAISYEDIKSTDFTIHRGKIDILTGGFPCQPYSVAGKRKGKNDERHLWPEMLRAIREISPRWVVGENVRGLINWNGGLVFDEVQSDLEAEGYEVQPFILPAASKNAPHRRDRVWFVAYSSSAASAKRNNQREKCKPENRTEIRAFDSPSSKDAPHPDSNGLSRNASDTESIWSREQSPKDKGWQDRRFDNDGKNEFTSDTSNQGLQGGQDKGVFRCGGQKSNEQFTRRIQPDWQNFPTQSPLCGGDDGLPSELDGITFPKWRNESIKGYGNAVVPQVVYQIFKAIQEYENTREI